MLILLAKARGSVRRSRLERSNEILRSSEPFASLGDETRSRMINAQSLIVEFEPEQAVATLPSLIPDLAERLRAAELCETIAGPLSEMEPKSIAMLDRLRAVLGLPPAGAAAAASQPLPQGAAAAPERAG
jgi:tellurite resistance protein